MAQLCTPSIDSDKSWSRGCTKRMAGLEFYVFVCFVSSLAAVVSSDTDVRPGSQWPMGDPRRCQELMKDTTFGAKSNLGVIPGVGWDNLRNVEAGLVVSYNYTQCKLTDDGQLLIPDNVFTVPIKYTRQGTYAELYTDYLSTTSTTSESININAGLSYSLFSISGSYSTENIEVKTRQLQEKSATARSQIRLDRYGVKLQPDSPLSPEFKSRLLSIASYIKLNMTELATYEAQNLVRDFGTHVVTSIVAGAALVKDDYLKRSFVTSSQSTDFKTSITIAASLSFGDFFGLSASVSHTNGQSSINRSTYTDNVAFSAAASQGGPLFQPNTMNVSDWLKGVDANLVAIDRDGDPIHSLIKPQLLPEIPAPIVTKLAKIVEKQVLQYYEMNTIRGCTEITSPNFSPSANVDDGSCNVQPNNLTFGGVYQTCYVTGSYLDRNPCTDLRTVNSKTGSQSCPPNYVAVSLRSGSKSQYESKQSCRGCGFLWLDTCCDTIPYNSAGNYEAYWCAAKGPVSDQSGYLFGGLYTSSSTNPVTLTTSCPRSFSPYSLLNDLSVCLSDSYSTSQPLAVPFGGFFSCSGGNPLAGNNTAKKCPNGYSQSLALVEQGCSIYYCTQPSKTPALQPIKRPPFMSQPGDYVRSDDNQLVFDVANLTWVRINVTEQAQQGAMEGVITCSSVDSSNLTPGQAAGIAVGTGLACILICVGIFLILICRLKKSRNKPPVNNLEQRRESKETNPYVNFQKSFA